MRGEAVEAQKLEVGLYLPEHRSEVVDIKLDQTFVDLDGNEFQGTLVTLRSRFSNKVSQKRWRPNLQVRVRRDENHPAEKF